MYPNKLNKLSYCWDSFNYDKINDTGWPLSRQCEIPWHFHDSSRHSAC